MADLHPAIPSEITVHLGTPTSNAKNVTVPFLSYVKNVASSEIFPSWPEASLRANIIAIVTFALNRVYTEWYRSQGYDFDITNTTQYDQSFNYGRDIFENISTITDEIFNDYIVRQGTVQPLFAQFCNGTTTTCQGLSQWGTVGLAEDGFTPYQILQYYYGDNINIVKNAPVGSFVESYPGRPLRIGDFGNDVRTIQFELNRISDNYPAIPKIPVVDGIFKNSTEDAVLKFQSIFSLAQDGVIGKGTWYKIKYIYNSVRRLSDLTAEAIPIEELTPQYPITLQLGSQGLAVRYAQYYLNIIALFIDALEPIPVDGKFGVQTQQAVENFQRYYGLEPTGIIDRNTINKLVDVYLGIVESLPPGYEGERAKYYPGYILSFGMENDDVRDLQTYLSLIGKTYAVLPTVPITGHYGEVTENAVRAFQKAFALPETGSVGATTWGDIAAAYDAITLSRLRDNNGSSNGNGSG
ncbi:MAG: peptidoglycan-binding protein, partial [Oscillospiraceae bacterium]|nr:peptidoglycan-binding protein [Oscillospiraceae bacterium]